jgi:methylated-DNA-[protein]-cysteine S-methyltransferase
LPEISRFGLVGRFIWDGTRLREVDDMRHAQAHWMIYESPIGPLTIVAGPSGITNLNFPGRLRTPAEAAKRPMPETVSHLEAYFAGELQTFDLALDLHGTPLQKAVWDELLRIPYGTTTSYGELAGRIDESLYRSDVEPYRRARVVGAANGRNPVSIIVPCHRVIGADGSLTGYGGGLQRKQALIDLERRSLAGEPLDPSWSNRQLAMI